MQPRQIKFRALKDDMSNCNFVYGQLVYDSIGTPRITHVDKSGDGLTFHTCLKGTEGQFTGLLDKNGSEIYEGDIIDDMPPSVVQYGIQSVDAFEGVGFNLWGFYGHYEDIGKAIRLQSELEIIGNIHENPELLNQ